MQQSRSVKRFTASVLSLALLSLAAAQAKDVSSNIESERKSVNSQLSATPALSKYKDSFIDGNLWKRPDLSPRDRSIVTLAILITRNQTDELREYLNLALDSGVKPKEISEIITHLAFYAGWGNANFAATAAQQVFAERKIGADQLPAASPALMPIDQKAEADRAVRVEESAGTVSPGLVLFTGDLLFKDLWLRPDLAPRDRSLVTVSSLIASGQFAQVTFHLGKAMDNGLTQKEAGEVIAQAAFYAGWPNAFSAVPIFKSVFEARSKK
jgi:4-carboxymuconolactone decarboxylase